jgi:tRNA nucleotidyltransferase/poly(A) polymerase
LIKTGRDTFSIEDMDRYQQRVRTNCYKLADKLGYAIIDSLKKDSAKTEIEHTIIKPANHFHKMIFVTQRTQELLALNPGVDYEILLRRAERIFDLMSLPATTFVHEVELIKKECRLDIATLALLETKKFELIFAAMSKAHPENNRQATASQKAVNIDALITTFKQAGLNESALPHLINLLEFDLDSGLLTKKQQIVVLDHIIELLISVYQLPNRKNIPATNEKKMAEKFSKLNPEKAIQYINHAIREEQVNPRDYIFRADMRLRLAKTTLDYQLILADYYFAKWIMYRGYASPILAEHEIKKIAHQINVTKERIAAGNKPVVKAQSDTSASEEKNSSQPTPAKSNPKKKKKKATAPNTATQNTSAAVTTQSSLDGAKQDDTPRPPSPKPKETGAHAAASAAAAIITGPIISSDDYGDWAEDTDFTPYTSRKQKRNTQREQQPPQRNQHQPSVSIPSNNIYRRSSQAAAIHSMPHRTQPAPLLPVASKPTPHAIAPLNIPPVAIDTTSKASEISAAQHNDITPEIKSEIAETLKITLPSEAREIILKLKAHGAKLSLAVGGIVRDELLDISTQTADIDLVTQATSAQLKEWFPLKDYPDLVITKDDKLFQFTLNKRKIEIWSSDHLANSNAVDPIKDDAESRDFNIDAIFSDEDGNVIDPCNAYGCQEIDTLIDSMDSLQYDSIRILRAIYLAKKLDFAISARLDKAIDASIASLAKADKFALRSIFSKILATEKCADILNEFEKRGIFSAIFPEFTDALAERDIAERIRSVSPENSLPWVYINMAVDASIDTNKARRVMEIANPQQKLAAIDQLLTELQQNIARCRNNKLFSLTFADSNYFEKLLETAFQSNRTMASLQTEKSILIKAEEQSKAAISSYAEANNLLRQQNELLIQELQRQKQQEYHQEALRQEALHQQALHQQALHQQALQQQAAQQEYQYMMYQQAMFAHSRQNNRVLMQQFPPTAQAAYHQPQQAATFAQHRNGFVKSWPKPQPPSEQQHASQPMDNKVNTNKM